MKPLEKAANKIKEDNPFWSDEIELVRLSVESIFKTKLGRELSSIFLDEMEKDIIAREKSMKKKKIKNIKIDKRQRKDIGDLTPIKDSIQENEKE